MNEPELLLAAIDSERRSVCSGSLMRAQPLAQSVAPLAYTVTEPSARLLAPEPAALFRLLQHPPAWMGADDAQELRDSTEEFSVVLRDMQGLQERIKLLQEEIAASVQEANSRSLFVLTVVTVLALPINILAGLLGMNVGGIPLADSEHGFWVIVGILVVFTAVAGWLALRGTRDK